MHFTDGTPHGLGLHSTLHYEALRVVYLERTNMLHFLFAWSRDQGNVECHQGIWIAAPWILEPRLCLPKVLPDNPLGWEKLKFGVPHGVADKRVPARASNSCFKSQYLRNYNSWSNIPNTKMYYSCLNYKLFPFNDRFRSNCNTKWWTVNSWLLPSGWGSGTNEELAGILFWLSILFMVNASFILCGLFYCRA